MDQESSGLPLGIGRADALHISLSDILSPKFIHLEKRMNLTPEKIIEILELETLPVEGGLFRQTYVSAESIPRKHLPDRYVTDKPFGTAIYYLLTSDPNSFSALHKLPTDEIWHFYLGDPVELFELHPDGSSQAVIENRLCESIPELHNGGAQVYQTGRSRLRPQKRIVEIILEDLGAGLCRCPIV